MPPARDLNDVQRLTAEYQRLTRDAVAEPGRYADALLLLAAVHSSLRDGPAPAAIDDALAKIDGYMRKHERDDPPLPKDVVRYVRLAKTWLEDAKMGPSPELLPLRERIHHEIMHPLQRILLVQVEQMQTTALQLQAMMNGLNARVVSVNQAVASASPEKP